MKLHYILGNKKNFTNGSFKSNKQTIGIIFSLSWERGKGLCNVTCTRWMESVMEVMNQKTERSEETDNPNKSFLKARISNLQKDM